MLAGTWFRAFLKRRKFQRSTPPSLLGGTSAGEGETKIVCYEFILL
jgi:hypothetical protein